MRISVQVKTNSKVESVERLPDGSYLVRVRVPPVDAKANERILELLSEQRGRAAGTISEVPHRSVWFKDPLKTPLDYALEKLGPNMKDVFPKKTEWQVNNPCRRLAYALPRRRPGVGIPCHRQENYEFSERIEDRYLENPGCLSFFQKGRLTSDGRLQIGVLAVDASALRHRLKFGDASQTRATVNKCVNAEGRRCIMQPLARLFC